MQFALAALIVGFFQISEARLSAGDIASLASPISENVGKERSLSAYRVDKNGNKVVYYESCLNETWTRPYQRTGKISAEDLKEYSVPSRCRNLNSLGNRYLITANYNSNITWMTDTISIPYFVYHAGNKTQRHHNPNFGNEAMAYLMFISEYYDCLPEVTLFAHAHRISSWHSTNTLDFNIRTARWDKVPGYAVLHRQGMWWDQYVKNTSLNLEGNEMPYPEGGERADDDCEGLINGTAYVGRQAYAYERAEWVSQAWDTFFEPAGLGEIMDRTRCPVAAEFFVTKERIRQRPRKFYQQAMHWIMNAKSVGMTSYSTGAVFEHLWHFIFGEPAQMDRLTIEECDLYDCSISS